MSPKNLKSHIGGALYVVNVAVGIAQDVTSSVISHVPFVGSKLS